jgi:branched-chain amino acid transport system ATP-binding protein
MLVEVKDLRVLFGKVVALKGISLELSEGEIITIIGANGAGKTTLLRTISGLKSPNSGEIWFQGKRIDKAPPFKIVSAGIAHVPEGRRIFPGMTVLENLKMGAFLQKTGLDKNLEVVYQYFPRLKERTRQRAGSLSGGEQQMLAMGRALMARPKLLLLDEPSMGLSPIMVKEIGKIIVNINRQEKVSVILVEQNANMALQLAQRAYVLETGCVALSGDTCTLREDDRVRVAYLGG